MSIANFAKTVSSTALSVSGDRLMLANPTAPYELPDANPGDCGYVVLLRQENSAGGCQVTATEVIQYSGYEEDGRTLIITKRGVGTTNAENWPLGTLVTQPFLREHYECLKKCKPDCLTLEDLRANMRLTLEGDFLKLMWGDEVIDSQCLAKFEEISDTGEWTYGSGCTGYEVL